MSSDMQKILGQLIATATSMSAKQLAALLSLAERLSSADSEEKGFQFTEYTYLYKIATGHYYARVNLKKLVPHFQIHDKFGRYYRKCLGRVDLETAKKKCWGLEADLRAQEKHGELATNAHSSTAQILMQFMRKLKQKGFSNTSTTYEYYKCLYHNLLPAVMQLGQIRYFDSRFLFNYFESLKEQGLIASKTRLVLHRSAVRRFIAYCVREGFIKDGAVPDIPDPKEILDGDKLKQEEENEPFEAADLQIIRANFLPFVNAIQRKKPEVVYLRSMLKWYFEFLCEMGCRPGEETLGVQFSEIVKKKGASGEYFMVTFSKGKTAETVGPREVELFPAAVEIVKEIVKYRFGKVMSMDEILKLPGHLFYNDEEQNQPVFSKTWTQFRNFLNKNAPVSKHYNLYSARHEYINRALDLGATLRDVARHCGNSVLTIERHYEKYSVERQKNRRDSNEV